MQSFELAWKDVMLLLKQIWTISEKNNVLENVQSWGDEWYAVNARGRLEEE